MTQADSNRGDKVVAQIKVLHTATQSIWNRTRDVIEPLSLKVQGQRAVTLGSCIDTQLICYPYGKCKQ